MSTRDKALCIALWAAVLGLSLWVGGTVFNMLVIVPLWSSSPPASVQAFFGGTEFNRTVFNFFGPPWMALRNFPIFVALVLAWHRPVHRRLLLVTTACVAFGLVFTLAYVYRINDVLMNPVGSSASGAEIQALVRRWIWADRLRFAVGVVGYVTLLRAFSLPLRRPAA